ncbi:PREDICTED: uncharacterized protein LOC105152417 [Acromyrmex echinatior]|uniref:uncharacterized protein LOC105152417 n=1 Tax=Acromyrmex echinatior TaxID=103372 RepID=UPI000580EC15|nr:PREDICTED: uncharacterized protein LOC105152417 [Acromyrmex echinatior]
MKYRIQDIWTFKYNFEHIFGYSVSILNNILFLTLNYICQTIYYKTNKTIAILHKLSNYNLDEELRKQILQFILQIKLREVKFGIGQFHYGYDFIYQMYSAVLAFLIILIQE